MVSLLALVIAVLFAVAAYAIRHGNTIRLVIGLSILANAVNLLIISVGFQGDVAPFIGTAGTPADPLVQALVLTAIVIGLGVTAFALGLAYVLIREEESTEVEDLRELKG